MLAGEDVRTSRPSYRKYLPILTAYSRCPVGEHRCRRRTLHPLRKALQSPLL
jgi:hypothetical protein